MALDMKTIGTLVGSAIATAICNMLLQPVSLLLQSSGYMDPDSYSVMSRYCEDLTEQAKLGEGQEAVARDKEIDSLIDILSQEGKANACVTGDAGVGKTALVEGLAYRIATGDVPDDFKDKRVIKVNMVSLIAGNAYSKSDGAVTRMRALFDKAKQDPNIILFIDEFHQIVQCGAGELFKTYLDRPGVHVVAATTTSEYSYISKDPALERRFKKLVLEELDPSQTLSVLENLRPKFEEKSGVKINGSALMSAVDLTGKYMRNRTYPDKAIDVLSLASKLVERRDKKAGSNVIPEVKEEDIQSVITAETGIPLGPITAVESKRLSSIKDRVGSSIIGQKEAVDKLCGAVRNARNGFVNASKPKSSFLLTGTSGVGKTALAERAGHEMGNLVKINTAHSSIDDKFLEQIWKKPYSLVVLDNIDRADRITFNQILGILEDGFTYDSHRRKIDFTNSIVVMTSSVGDDIILNDTQNDTNTLKQKVLSKVEERFGSNFVNKLDDVLVFDKLNQSDAKEILRIFADRLENKMSTKNISLKIGDDVLGDMAKKDINHRIGAVGLQKKVAEKLESPLMEMLLSGKIKKGDHISCRLEDHDIKFETGKLKR